MVNKKAKNEQKIFCCDIMDIIMVIMPQSLYIKEEFDMAFEIDFIGIRQDLCKKDADAIAIRWQDESTYKVAIYDGGFQVHGEALVKHLNTYYFDACKRIIDAVIVSHPDQDHTAGLKEVLENFTVNALYMNRPWKYAIELYDKVSDGRMTPNSLEKHLKNKYPFIADLETIAMEKNIPIFDAFEGTIVSGALTILSPSEQFYKDLIVESDKTPLENKSQDGLFESFLSAAKHSVRNALESWGVETLRENVSTSAENEMSVVLLGQVSVDKFLLVGDAGIRALSNAMDYAEYYLNVKLSDTVKFFQIPHHGGRHNVSPSILNRMLGPKRLVEFANDRTAFVSAADDSDHPLQMVVNAYLRRGCKVYKNGGVNLWHHVGMPIRSGYSSAKEEKFNEHVEDWED